MRKLSKAEAGKLGAEASRAIISQKKQERINLYSKNPKHCKNCDSIISYENKKKDFCNSSCSAKFNNLKRNTRKVALTWKCLACDKEHETRRWLTNKYCNNKCQKQYEYEDAIKNWNNVTPGKNTIKKFLRETFGNKCSHCGIESWNNKPIILELEHKDGNADNNNIENLCLLCPNCHSQTSTFKGRNKGFGRSIRRIKYSEKNSKK